MRLAQPAAPLWSDDLQSRVLYSLFLPLFAFAEGVKRFFGRHFVDDSEPAPARGSWAAEVRSQALIATSFALMAQSMLQSSERRRRPGRPSRT